MSDYISREEVKARISQFYSTHTTMVLPALHRVVDNVSSADVRENIHGEWNAIDDEPHEDYECNLCGCIVSTWVSDIDPHKEFKFCPNCGADMRGE